MVDEKILHAAQAEVNHCRKLNNDKNIRAVENKGNENYLPPVTEFVTIEFRNGFVTVPADYFKSLSKAKQRKLMKF